MRGECSVIKSNENNIEQHYGDEAQQYMMQLQCIICDTLNST